jgi:hypothetical protein
MFGYIYPEKIELKIKEYELFKAYYCGVCLSIKNRHKMLSRMTLTYDATFLAIFLDSFNNDAVSVKKRVCIAHPVKKRNMMYDNKFLDYAADMNILLSYYNMIDDWKDEKSIIKLFFSIALRKSLKKVQNLFPVKCAIIKKCLEEIYKLEKEKCNIPEKLATEFGKLMEEVLYERSVISENESIIRSIGRNIGKWIYLLDAYDDIGDDLKKGKFNPVIEKYNLTKENYEEKEKEIKNDIEFSLIYTLSEISNDYKKLDIEKNTGILDNIFYMGMLRKTESILEKDIKIDVDKKKEEIKTEK